MIRPESFYIERPWRREGLTPSQAEKKYRGGYMSAILSLTDTRVRTFTPEEIVGHVRQTAFAAPGWLHARALRKSADHHEAKYGSDDYLHRLRQAAQILWDGGEGVRPPPSPSATEAVVIVKRETPEAEGTKPVPRTRRTRQALPATHRPNEPERLRLPSHSPDTPRTP